MAKLPIPMWLKSVLILAPLSAPVLGAVSGTLSGGQAAATERAVLAERVERMSADIDKLGDKVERLTETILKR